MTPEAMRALAKVFARHPEWTDVDGARRVNGFRRVARALVLGMDGVTDEKASSREQIAALRLCDRIADIFDPVLGGPHAGVNRDDLWRIVTPVFTFDEPMETNIEERRARAVVVVVDAGKARDSVARGMVAVLSQVAHPIFGRLDNRLPFVTGELGNFDYVALDIDAMGLELHLVKEGEVLSKESRSHQKLIHRIKVVMAQNYVDNLSEEVVKVLDQKAKGGKWPTYACFATSTEPRSPIPSASRPK